MTESNGNNYHPIPNKIMHTTRHSGNKKMIFRRMIHIITLSTLLSISLFSTQALAKTPKALVTASGNSIHFSNTSAQLSQLLTKLGEPAWTRKELNHLTKSVHAYLRAFTGRQYARTLEALQRGDRYRPMIRAKLKQAKIPLPFEALAMAESAYRFNIKSRAGARGLWQYMPASARHYGLHVSRKLDQRIDPALSTDAAIKYLKFLNKKFKKVSVLLSVAAYNAGEGRIAKVVKRSGVKSGRQGYSRIVRFLPKETRGYIPEFLAAALILKNPSLYGFPVEKQNKHRYVQFHTPLSIKKISQSSKLPIKEIRQLTSELKKSISTPSNNFLLRLPIQAAERLKSRLGNEITVWKSYTLPISLASVHLKKQNGGTRSRSQIVYQVRKGNHLVGIAKIFSVPVHDLRQKNRIQRSQIQIGQSLIIPTKKQLNKKTYRVKSGDNLGLIARRLGISLHHLKFVNGVINPRRLRLGQRLIYYV